ncbi:hypothetical protein APY04_3345 [Hyphomicrobium sulfonivorans]|uniref:Uncharacterized protein n=1 Tax=Hyphomicrobium sulfonivorans TaxID=121290 RepID=A0A120CTA0_HYPSL|nr:hypothetical protein APY04_3345 [Hyphomicrobium sulfonivorans]
MVLRSEILPSEQAAFSEQVLFFAFLSCSAFLNAPVQA